jgi:hypothetical protein
MRKQSRTLTSQIALPMATRILSSLPSTITTGISIQASK